MGIPVRQKKPDQNHLRTEPQSPRLPFHTCRSASFVRGSGDRHRSRPPVAVVVAVLSRPIGRVWAGAATAQGFVRPTERPQHDANLPSRSSTQVMLSLVIERVAACISPVESP